MTQLESPRKGIITRKITSTSAKENFHPEKLISLSLDPVRARKMHHLAPEKMAIRNNPALCAVLSSVLCAAKKIRVPA